MFIAGILLFSALVPLLTYLIVRSGSADPSRFAVSLVLVAWGSLFVGLLLAKVQN